MPHPFASLFASPERRVAGLMSGTSLDGVDAVLAELDGSGPGLSMQVLAFTFHPYPPALKAELADNVLAETSSVRALSQLNSRLAHVYAEAVRATLAETDLTIHDLDLVGMHGQTVQHIPNPEPCGGVPTTSTLQIGDPAGVANLLGVPVIGDFRTADMTLGGQGAPLVPYFDYVRFTAPHETRGLLNLGGIANLTLLPAGGQPSDVRAFDTGPSNMLLDALTQQYFDQPYDAGGVYAAQGSVQTALLEKWLADPYFAIPPPKSTGRAYFGGAFLQQILEDGTAYAPHDVLATATALTAHSIHRAYIDFLAPRGTLDVLIAAGGGIHNATLMRHLATCFEGLPIKTVQDYGVDPDGKEALCFAVLAHEWMNGIPTNLPSVTGASHPTLLGKLCLPAPHLLNRPSS